MVPTSLLVQVQAEVFLEFAAFLRLPGAPGRYVSTSHPLAALRDAHAESADELLPRTSEGFGPRDPPRSSPPEDVRAFGRELMRHACALCPWDERLAAVAMGCASSGGGVRREARRLLKRRPDDLRLWRAYGAAEEADANPDEAARVYASALALSPPPSASDASRAPVVAIAYAAAKLALRRDARRDGDARGAERAAAAAAAARSLARAWIADAADGAPLSQPQLLRARRHYEDALTGVLGPKIAEKSRDPTLDADAADIVCAHALFVYLTAGADAACHVYDRVLDALEPPQQQPAQQPAAEQPALAGAGSASHERVLEEATWLLTFHVADAPLPPARLRSVLTRALRTFPANVAFLGALLAERRGRFGVRRMLAEMCRRQPACPQLWLAAVRFELDGVAPEPGGDDSAWQRARSILEAAVRPSACGGCAAIWREYVRLESTLGRGVDAACRVHFRGVQQCPGAKALWCDAMSLPLVAAAPESHLRDTIEGMGTKELRLRAEQPALEADEGHAAP